MATALNPKAPVKWTDLCGVVVDRTDRGLRQCSEIRLGNGSATAFDLPHGSVFGVQVTLDGVGLSSHDYGIVAEGGVTGGDQVVFTVAPASGVIIVIRYYWRGSPQGVFHTTRRSLDLPVSMDDQYYTCTGYETLWMIAGRRDVYGDTALWWVLVDCNQELNNVFEALLVPIQAGVVLRVPSLSRVSAAMGE